MKHFLFAITILVISSLFFTPKASAQGRPDVVLDSYIVVLNENTETPGKAVSDMANKYGLSPQHIYSHALKGFSAIVPEGRLNALKNDPRVKYVSEDRIVSIDVQAKGKPTPTPVPQPPQETPFGVTRIGVNTTNKGAGVGVAVIDTGIDLTHPDLSVIANKTCINRTTTGNDDNGHGTHVAGTIAGRFNYIGVVGVAPEANLYAVKVLDKRGSGSWSSVLCGINWVTENAQTLNIKVANMSLGGTGTSDDKCGQINNDALHEAICNSTKAGVTYVVAAGNERDNAKNHVPAAYDDTVITVSALVDTDGLKGGFGGSTGYGPDDTFASFSNYGDIVDLGAPGVNIYSTWKNGGYNTISGTSMATPHVSGAAAIYIGVHGNQPWVQVRDGLNGAGEPLNSGHFDLSGLHKENVVLTGSL